MCGYSNGSMCWRNLGGIFVELLKFEITMLCFLSFLKKMSKFGTDFELNIFYLTTF